ncbi:hypothetical protein NE237_022103 [Protea cynaroides]|uniref:Uncharacterized protein n=1 Tax=Protea cynaroides TaxID=273540 RepID=A0A9Q0K373_9MAGN|nr:hypothetical protein NE237_022103 [Protea cynaroides]
MDSAGGGLSSIFGSGTVGRGRDTAEELEISNLMSSVGQGNVVLGLGGTSRSSSVTSDLWQSTFAPARVLNAEMINIPTASSPRISEPNVSGGRAVPHILWPSDFGHGILGRVAGGGFAATARPMVRSGFYGGGLTFGAGNSSSGPSVPFRFGFSAEQRSIIGGSGSELQKTNGVLQHVLGNEQKKCQ